VEAVSPAYAYGNWRQFVPPKAPPPKAEEQVMGVHYDKTRGKYTVRWTDDGRRRIKRFCTKDEAVAFDEEIQAQAGRLDAPAAEAVAREPGRGDGIYSYATTKGKRWRFVFRQSDGTISSRRGFTSRTAAATAKRRLTESIERGEVKVSRETSAKFWETVLAQKRRYVTVGS
jgi:urease beta subunit